MPKRFRGPAPGQASSAPGGAGPDAAGEHAYVTRRLPRALRRIERDLAGSDPGLDALFRSFARRRGCCDMSWVERVGRKRFLLFGRRRQRTLSERIKDWYAENWTDP